MITNNLSFQITWDCDAKCAHCFQEHVNYNLSIEKTIELIKFMFSRYKLTHINFTGGEPFLRYDFLKEVMQFNNRLKLKSRVITNCKWCESEELIYERIEELTANGLDLVTVSYDYFHSRYIPLDNIIRFIKVCNEIGLDVVLYSSLSTATEQKTRALIKKLKSKTNFEVLYRWVIPPGKSKLKTMNTKKIEDLPNCCSIQNIYTIWPNGEVLTCCSVGTSKKLSVGNLNDDSFEDLLNRRCNNDIYKIIEHEGPKGIYDRLPNELKNLFSGKGYVNNCHFCSEIVNHPETFKYLQVMKINDIDIANKILL
ncbi:radical SAM/SPASM domain-containing protein [Bacillus cereus group sp. MYBK132-2]|uniref:radical SAM/SPASM domain-containing protein n=1 Tax=unclassified Bacillus cereus group TaxID=2750818 RepID=UPI003F78F865